MTIQLYLRSKLITLCGIIGIWAKNKSNVFSDDQMNSALNVMQHRGPDNLSFKTYANVQLGHARLSILDPNPRANQPFCSNDGRYALIFNGEIYNYRELRNKLPQIDYKTDADTEVLLHLLVKFGKKALNMLDGFFALVFYDHYKNELIVARDGIGIKPLYCYEDEDKFIFSSELSPLFSFDTEIDLNHKAINYYFGLTYVPAPYSILSKVKKVFPGEVILLNNEESCSFFFKERNNHPNSLSFEDYSQRLRSVLTKSVSNRLIADVPLGCFLSGGIDSSIIAAIAIKLKPDLKTFSVGFDVPYFDETNYANDVAKKIGSQHTVFKLSKEDFKQNFTSFLKSIDEPFADSSAFAMYILSQKTSREVKVALSGDGADELFGGYRKHSAEYRMQNLKKSEKLALNLFATFLKPLPLNRSNKIGDLNRKIQKFNIGLNLTSAQRYWNWCNFISETDRKELLREFQHVEFPYSVDWGQEDAHLEADQKLVLPNDMLKKVDLMSMAHGLEVRTPFLSWDMVNLANSIPLEYKFNNYSGKHILKETFKDVLPDSVLNRSKKGFEIPIKAWLNEEISSILNGHLFTASFIDKQGLFDYAKINELKETWGSKDFGDRIYLVWSLIVFQHWYQQFIIKQ